MGGLLFADAAQAGDGAGVAVGAGALILLGLAGLVFGLAPTWIALLRGHPNAVPILLVNLFFGWLCFGWIVALIWAFSATEQAVVVRDVRRRRRDYDDED